MCFSNRNGKRKERKKKSKRILVSQNIQLNVVKYSACVGLLLAYNPTTYNIKICLCFYFMPNKFCIFAQNDWNCTLFHTFCSYVFPFTLFYLIISNNLFANKLKFILFLWMHKQFIYYCSVVFFSELFELGKRCFLQIFR